MAMNNLPILAGNNGSLVIPLIDPQTQGAPLLSYGPYRDRHNFRLFAKLPEKSDAEKLPCGYQHDRSSVRFDIQRVMLLSALPLGVTSSIYDISTPYGKAKYKKVEMHRWTTKGPSEFYVGLDIHLPLLSPGDHITISGVSRFTNAKGVKTNPFAMMPGGLQYPTFKQTLPINLSLFCTLSWLPKQVQRTQIKVVNGDPLSAYTPTSMVSHAAASSGEDS